VRSLERRLPQKRRTEGCPCLFDLRGCRSRCLIRIAENVVIEHRGAVLPSVAWGRSLMESVYGVLLADALREKGLSVERQKSIPMSAPWDSFLIAARSARLSATPVRKSAFALAGQWTEKILCRRFRCPPQLLPLTECSSKNLLHH